MDTVTLGALIAGATTVVGTLGALGGKWMERRATTEAKSVDPEVADINGRWAAERTAISDIKEIIPQLLGAVKEQREEIRKLRAEQKSEREECDARIGKLEARAEAAERRVGELEREVKTLRRASEPKLVAVKP